MNKYASECTRAARPPYAMDLLFQLPKPDGKQILFSCVFNSLCLGLVGVQFGWGSAVMLLYLVFTLNGFIFTRFFQQVQSMAGKYEPRCTSSLPMKSACTTWVFIRGSSQTRLFVRSTIKILRTDFSPGADIAHCTISWGYWASMQTITLNVSAY